MNNSSNSYFDIDFQVAQEETKVIRVMTTKSDISKCQLLLDKCNSEQAVQLSNIRTAANLTVGETDRSDKGRRILQPHKLQTEVLLWEKTVNTEETAITSADKQHILLSEQDQKPQNTICCPDVLNVHVNIYPVCNNRECRKKVAANLGSEILQCHTCNRSMLLKNCYIEINASFQLEKENKETNATAFAKVLSSFLNEDVYQYKDNKEELTNKLLLLEGIDFHLSQTGKLITNITNHPKSQEEGTNHPESQEEGSTSKTT
ncbi:hypothetical protein OS493_012906 [Desmophyllum pertusum]|uniref:Uncharacterized protein n=1 Tax=Desmophyllum pertusum TaxID=174260 RepID=A0A9W9Z1M7_9CNID|nr:hypothetical protein OS493_012906 [Desmophyllum pertusum]